MPARGGSRTGALPELIRPMLAVPGQLPPAAEDDRWGYEVKWDGIRAVAYVENRRLRLLSRSDRDITRRYPELAALPDALAEAAAVLDGELVCLDAAGRPSFARLAHRMHIADPGEARRLTGSYPVTFMVFDLLHAGTESLLPLPYQQRRTQLTALAPEGGAWQLSPAWFGGGADLLTATIEQGLEGVIAKRLDSAYLPGRRSPAWRKIKNVRTIDVRIGGWNPGEGTRAATIGSLILGVPTPDGLAFIGHVGTGFTDATLRDLTTRLAALAIPTSPFDARPVPPEFAGRARWVRPELAAVVAYAELSPDGRLRHPRWRGLKKSPR